MKGIRIQGGMPLQGKVRIQGSKNAALPILAATLLTNEVSYIQNCPRIEDVHRFVHLLRELGCMVHWQENGIRVQPGGRDDLPCERAEARRMRGEAITGMRSSLCLLGALLGKCGYVTMEHPGGCVIGDRPIDLHIHALEQMGVEFLEEDGLLSARAKNLHGAQITLKFPSVGATENILLAAVKATGDTVITGAAREPEVIALCEWRRRSSRNPVYSSDGPDCGRNVSVWLYRLRRECTVKSGTLEPDGSSDCGCGENGGTMYRLRRGIVRTGTGETQEYRASADRTVPGIPHRSAVGGDGGTDHGRGNQLY